MNYVTYIRVSTKGQQDSGNGLEIQKTALANFVASRAGTITAEFCEVLSGAKKERPQLTLAIESCIKTKSVLLIHKVDRLSREGTLLDLLRAKKVEFCFANMPEANSLTLDLLMVISKHEKTTINERTKAGQLAVIKKHGTLHYKKGTKNNIVGEMQHLAVKAIKEKALHNENNKRATAFISAFPLDTKTSVICQKLNKAGFMTSQGKTFTITQVTRLRKKI